MVSRAFPLAPRPAATLALSFVLATASLASAAAPVVRLTPLTDRVRIEVEGALFTEYRFGVDAPKPFLFPVLGPGGVPFTRSFPMAEVAGEARDHPHHRSLWFAHGSVGGIDFWLERPGVTGVIRHDALVETSSGSIGVLRVRNRWTGPKGEPVCTDETEIRVSTQGRSRLLDYAITFTALPDKPLVFGDTKEGTMALRLTPWLTPPHKVKGVEVPSEARMVNSEGGSGAGIWGQRAAWVSYSGKNAGRTLGVSMIESVANPRFPTWWHARDYGLFAANPFGRHDFEAKKDEPRLGEMVVPPGKSVTFRYRLVFHEGDAAAASIADMARTWAAKR
jgi:hypothetical protein